MQPFRAPHRQAGLSLIELLVGLTLGLLILASALATILLSHQLTTTVTEASQMQQQASYAFRVIGQQLRQAGGREFQDHGNPYEPVIFRPIAIAYQAVSGGDFGGDLPAQLSLAYEHAAKPAYPLAGNAPALRQLMRNCLGDQAGSGDLALIISHFQHRDQQLVCAGASGLTQPIISGVQDFQVRYLVSQADASGRPNRFTYRRSYAPEPGPSEQLEAVEVCLELQGELRLPGLGAEYQDCRDTPAALADRRRMVFHHIFYLPSRAWSIQ